MSDAGLWVKFFPSGVVHLRETSEDGGMLCGKLLWELRDKILKGPPPVGAKICKVCLSSLEARERRYIKGGER